MSRLTLLLSLPLLVWSLMARTLVSVVDPQQGQAPPAGISTAQLHFFFVPVGEVVRVAEFHVLSNEGNEPYLGTEMGSGVRRTVGFQLPDGATNLHFEGPGLGERFVEEAGGFFDTEPIPPGEGTLSIRYSYDLPFTPGLTLVRQSELPVASIVAIVTGEGLALEGAGLVYQGTMDTQMGPAAQYTAGSLEPGQKLVLSVVEGEPAEPTTAAQAAAPARNATTEWGLGLASVALAAVVAYTLWRPGASSPMPERVRGSVEELAALEDALERGAMSREEYGRRRAALLKRMRGRLASEREA